MPNDKAEHPAQASPTPKEGAEVQKKLDEENAQGFHGTEVDPTPDENYTVGGVIAGKPTPETDHAAHAEARDAAGLNPNPHPKPEK